MESFLSEELSLNSLALQEGRLQVGAQVNFERFTVSYRVSKRVRRLQIGFFLDRCGLQSLERARVCIRVSLFFRTNDEDQCQKDVNSRSMSWTHEPTRLHVGALELTRRF